MSVVPQGQRNISFCAATRRPAGGELFILLLRCGGEAMEDGIWPCEVLSVGYEMCVCSLECEP